MTTPNPTLKLKVSPPTSLKLRLAAGRQGDIGPQGPPGPIGPIGPPGVGTVTSIYGRAGVVTAQAGDYTALQVTFAAAGGILSVNVQNALVELDTKKAPLASPTLTGTPAVPTAAPGTNTTQAASTAFVTAAVAAGPAAPVTSVFGRTGVVIGVAGDYNAVKITNVPAGGISATDVQAALNGLDTAKANLASPTLTGAPISTTPAVDDNTTKIATTAYVIGQASAVADGTPAMNGVAARGVAIHWARADHVHPTDTSLAPLASPALTGAPTVPTAAPGTNTTVAASTAFVTAAVAAGVTVSDEQIALKSAFFN